MKIAFTSLLFLTVIFLFAQKDDEKKKMEAEWKLFFNAVEKNDSIYLLSHCADTIYCSICGYSVLDEATKMFQNRTDSINFINVYDSLYKSKTLLLKKLFLNSNLNYIFSKEIKDYCRQNERIKIFKNQDWYEVAITTTFPSNEYEGSQLFFQFRKKDDRFLLFGILSMP